jgi:hypothetical protein
MENAFLHIERYSRKGPHKKNSRLRKPSMGGILDELIRKPDACLHVEAPKPAVIIYGGDPSAVWDEAYELASRAVDKAGHRLKNTASIIVVGIVSWPVPRSQVENDETEKAKCERWIADTCAWLTQEFGAVLKLVVRHSDEPYEHVHFALLPTLGQDHRLFIGSIHPGDKAARDCDEEGGTRRQQKNAYDKAMKALQDRYSENVGEKHGLARLGPRRQRLTRDEWKTRKQQIDALAAAHEKVIKYAKDLKISADRRVADRIAEVEHQASLTAATIEADARQRMESLKSKAVRHVTTLSEKARELEDMDRHSTELIARQAEIIRALEARLEEQSLGCGPTL